MKMKQLLFLLMAVLLSGCAASAQTGSGSTEKTTAPKELIVFAAASLTESVSEIAALYEEIHPELTIRCSYDSSGTLKTQIEEGAECDLFLPAGQKQMNQLDIRAGSENDPDALDLILPESRIDLLENRVCLAVPDGNPSDVKSFKELAERLSNGSIFMVIGNEDVPVGQYSEEVLSSLGLSLSDLYASGVLTLASNAKEVTTQIKEASADCGIVYESDALSAGLTVVDHAGADLCRQILYPAAILRNAPQQETAKDFLAFLQGPEASEIFRSRGLTPIS